MDMVSSCRAEYNCSAQTVAEFAPHRSRNEREAALKAREKEWGWNGGDSAPSGERSP